jgi:hypothetical protein
LRERDAFDVQVLELRFAVGALDFSRLLADYRVGWLLS